MQQVKAALASILESMKSTDEMSEAEEQSQANWRAELVDWRVSTQLVDDEIGEIVLIEGSVMDAGIIFPLL